MGANELMAGLAFQFKWSRVEALAFVSSGSDEQHRKFVAR